MNRPPPVAIDLAMLSTVVDDYLGHLSVYVRSGRGTAAAREKEFRVKLEPFRERQHLVIGLNLMLTVLETAPAAAAPDASDEAKMKFIHALQAADKLKVPADVPRLNRLHALFASHRADWFLTMFSQDLPAVQDGEDFSGRKRIIIVETAAK